MVDEFVERVNAVAALRKMVWRWASQPKFIGSGLLFFWPLGQDILTRALNGLGR